MKVGGITVIALLSILLFVVGGVLGCNNHGTIRYVPPGDSTPEVRVPSAPSSLLASPISADTVELQWFDRSSNEDGFHVYRNSRQVGNLGENVSIYRDTSLSPATSYQYTVKAYNAAGESPGCSCTVRTPNPAITVRLEKIGVSDNRENWLRGRGEVYLGIVVSDGRTTVERRFPPEGQHFSLDKNEVLTVGETIFSVDEVDDTLTVFIIGYESDGGPLESIFYQALGIAAQGYFTGGSGSFLEAFGYGLGDIIGSIFGVEDDYLGSYEQTWTQSSNWGIGSYNDIGCYDERGVECLRVWFTVTSP
jgi:hypothetical protein